MTAKEIKDARSLAGLTQQELADKAGLSRNTIQGYENGRLIPRQSSELKLKKALGYETCNTAMRKAIAIERLELPISQLNTRGIYELLCHAYDLLDDDKYVEKTAVDSQEKNNQ